MTGQQLHRIWQDSLEKQGIASDRWFLLTEEDRIAWQAVADFLDAPTTEQGQLHD